MLQVWKYNISIPFVPQIVKETSSILLTRIIWEPMAIDNVSTDKSSVSKLLRDGQLIIKSGDNLFNAEGLRIK